MLTKLRLSLVLALGAALGAIPSCSPLALASSGVWPAAPGGVSSIQTFATQLCFANGQCVTGSGAGAVAWGDIMGSLSAQTDLVAALAAKQNTLTLGNLTGSAPFAITGGTGSIIGSGTAIAVASGYYFPTTTDQTNWNAKQPAGSYLTGLSGDVAATGPGVAAATINTVGGSSAANVHAAELLANAATALDTFGAIAKRDGSGQAAFAALTLPRGDVQAQIDSKLSAIPFAQTVFVNAGGNDTTCLAARLDLPCATVAGAMAKITNTTVNNLISIQSAGTYSVDGVSFLQNVLISCVDPTLVSLDFGNAGMTMDSSWGNSGNNTGGVSGCAMITSGSMPPTFDFSSFTSNNAIYFNNDTLPGSAIFDLIGNPASPSSTFFNLTNIVQNKGNLTITDTGAIIFGYFNSNDGLSQSVTASTSSSVIYSANSVYFGNVSVEGALAQCDLLLTSGSIFGSLTVDGASAGVLGQLGTLPAKPGITQTNGGQVILNGDAFGVAYSPAVPGNWPVPPADVSDALDDLAASGGGGGGAVSSVSNSDGSLTISPTTGAVVASLTPSGVTAGSYTAANITVNADGIVTAAANGSGGGGANTALSNLASTAINTDLLPAMNNGIEIGSASFLISNIFATGLNIDELWTYDQSAQIFNTYGGTFNLGGDLLGISDLVLTIGAKSNRAGNVFALGLNFDQLWDSQQNREMIDFTGGTFVLHTAPNFNSLTGTNAADGVNPQDLATVHNTQNPSTLKIPVSAATVTPTCNASGDQGPGTTAYTSLFVACVCNGSGWVQSANGTVTCTF